MGCPRFGLSKIVIGGPKECPFVPGSVAVETSSNIRLSAPSREVPQSRECFAVRVFLPRFHEAQPIAQPPSQQQKGTTEFEFGSP